MTRLLLGPPPHPSHRFVSVLSYIDSLIAPMLLSREGVNPKYLSEHATSSMTVCLNKAPIKGDCQNATTLGEFSRTRQIRTGSLLMWHSCLRSPSEVAYKREGTQRVALQLGAWYWRTPSARPSAYVPRSLCCCHEGCLRARSSVAAVGMCVFRGCF
jgi:hypothetical protein